VKSQQLDDRLYRRLKVLKFYACRGCQPLEDAKQGADTRAVNEADRPQIDDNAADKRGPGRFHARLELSRRQRIQPGCIDLHHQSIAIQRCVENRGHTLNYSGTGKTEAYSPASTGRTNTMNLLYVHESFGSLGGAEANVIITATEMKARGHTVGLWTRRPTGKGEERWRAVFEDRIHWLEKEELSAVRAARSPDVVYVHKWDDLPSLEALTRSGLPLVRMVHDHDIYCLRSYRYHPLTRRVCHRPASPYCVFPCLATLKRKRDGGFPFAWVSYFDKLRELELNRRFHRHLVVTRYMKRELELNRFESSRIEIFPPVPRPGDSLRSNFSERNLLLYVGQLIRGKGVDVLLRALAKVKTPFEAVILGDGNHRAACERLSVRLGLSERVRFAGFIPQEELKAYYKEASAVLISSLWPEPIATVGLEVMRFALPVVAFDAGGISDWLHDGETGFLVPWKDTRAFARRIEELLADKSRARAMGERGLEIVSRDYDFGDYLRRLEELFARVRTEVAAQTSIPTA